MTITEPPTQKDKKSYKDVVAVHFLKIVFIAYPSALVKTHVDDAFEENEIGFGEFEGLELGSKQISIFGQEVLKQHWIHSAPVIERKPFLEIL